MLALFTYNIIYIKYIFFSNIDAVFPQFFNVIFLVIMIETSVVAFGSFSCLLIDWLWAFYFHKYTCSFTLRQHSVGYILLWNSILSTNISLFDLTRWCSFKNLGLSSCCPQETWLYSDFCAYWIFHGLQTPHPFLRWTLITVFFCFVNKLLL